MASGRRYPINVVLPAAPPKYDQRDQDNMRRSIRQALDAANSADRTLPTDTAGYLKNDGGGALTWDVLTAEDVGAGTFTGAFAFDASTVTITPPSSGAPNIALTHHASDLFATIRGPANRSIRMLLQDNTDGDEFYIENAAAAKVFSVARTGNADILGALSLGNKIQIGPDTFGGSKAQIYTDTAGGLFIIGETGTSYDFVLHNNQTLGQAVMRVATGTRNVEFLGLGSFAARLTVSVGGAVPEMLRLDPTVATASPYLTWYQAGNRKSFIQHDDNGDQFKIVSEYGPVVMRPGVAGTEQDRLIVDNTDSSDSANSPYRGFVKAVTAALFSTMYSHGTPSGNFTCFGRAGNKQHALLSANRTVTVTLEEDGQELTLYLQGSGGTRTITWSGVTTWADTQDNTAPSSKTNVYYFERISGSTVGYVISTDTLGVL